MYVKLAIENVKRSYKDYSVYFVTLLSAIALFYTFNSFGDQAVVLELNEIQNTTVRILKQIMEILSVVIGVVCGFLVLYANNFLVKRRKKEIGIYMLLGMETRTISKVLVFETVIISGASLVAGLLFGFIFSQLITSLTSYLLSANRSFQFVFSLDSLIWTLRCFGLIFLIAGLFNLLVINRYPLIELLRASRVNQIIKLRNSKMSIFLFIASVLCLSFVYYLGLVHSVKFIKTIVIVGAIGTVLFFYSSAGFFLSFITSRKKVYFRNLTMFVTRQINAKVNETYITISIVCLMLLISIGALLTGFNLNEFIKEEVEKIELFDYAIGYSTTKEEATNLRWLLDIDKSTIRDEFYSTTYKTTLSLSDFEEFYMDDINKNPLLNSRELKEKQIFSVIPISEINKLLEYQNMQKLHLKDNETVIFNANPALEKTFEKMHNMTLHPYGSEVSVLKILNMTFTLSIEPFFGTVLVLNDNNIPKKTIGTRVWSVKLYNSEAVPQVKSKLESKIHEYNQQNPTNNLLKQNINGIVRDTMVLEAKRLSEGISSLTVIITYISLYLGLIFLLCSVVILALQQLSEITDNKKRYTSLMVMGVEKKMINRALLIQLSTYFGFPLLLASIHSYFGVRVVLDVFKAHWGLANTFYPTFVGSSIILSIYLSYFIATYMLGKRIIYSDK